MFSRSNTKAPKWLTLLFVTSFLVNAQASVACAMMPDMSEQHTECCCGVSHRSAIPDNLEDTKSSVINTEENSEQDQGCENPRIGCCMLEVSVGLPDPPTDDQGLSVPAKNIEHNKIIKKLDFSPEAAGFNTPAIPTQFSRSKIASVFLDHLLQLHSPPLYKSTERYRI